jgi:putative phosphoesterase
MRIGVVSDTHLPRFGRALPAALTEALKKPRVDLIVHLGDFTGDEVPGLLERIAPLEAVAGNNDGPALVDRYGRRRVIQAHGIRFGLTHGDLGPGRTTPERALRAFEGEAVDVVLFGHSHIPMIRRTPAGRWLINPGSPTDRRRQPLASYALIDLGDGEVRPELHYLERPAPR